MNRVITFCSVILAAAFLLASVAVLLVASLLKPIDRQVVDLVLYEAQSAKMAETRAFRASIPEQIRVGEVAPVEVVLLPRATGGDPAPVSFRDLYEQNTVQAEARIELQGLQIDPPGVAIRPIEWKQPSSFYWNLNADQAGNFTGVLWIYLNLTPKDGGQSDQLRLLARQVDFKAVDIFGLSIQQARLAAAASFFLALVFVLLVRKVNVR